MSNGETVSGEFPDTSAPEPDISLLMDPTVRPLLANDKEIIA